MKLKVALPFSQRDPRWASIILGNNALNSPYTIGLYGCLITALGMYINDQPNNINQKLKANGGFSAGSGDFVWSKSTVLGLTPTYISPRYDGIPVTSQGLSKMKELLDAGFPLLTEIDFNPSTNGEEMHFVLVIGYEGNEFFIADSWTGTFVTLDIYGGAARAVIQFRAYDKKLELDGGTTVAVPSATFEELVRKSTITDKVAAKLNVEVSEAVILADIEKMLSLEDTVVQKDKQISDAQGKIADLETQIKELQDQQVIITGQKTTLEGKVTDLNKTIETQTSGIELLDKQVQQLKKDCKIPVLSGWKLSLWKWLQKQ